MSGSVVLLLFIANFFREFPGKAGYHKKDCLKESVSVS